MRHRVHALAVIRVPVEIEAVSQAEAVQKTADMISQTDARVYLSFFLALVKGKEEEFSRGDAAAKEGVADLRKPGKGKYGETNL